ncbi:hypothetical protein GBAR_LOCUS7703, partial [Geodia barretti]
QSLYIKTLIPNPNHSGYSHHSLVIYPNHSGYSHLFTLLGRTWHMFKLLFIKKKPLSPLTPLMEVEWYHCCTTQNRDGLVKILVGALDARSETAPSETAPRETAPMTKKMGGKENG